MGKAVTSLDRMLCGMIEAVILEEADRYVQFATHDNAVRCEAAGDRNLEAPLANEALDKLEAIGFLPPNAASAGNHWMELPRLPAVCLAKFAGKVLRMVYGIDLGLIQVTEV